MATILVVDDNADNRFVLSQMLRLNGFQTYTAINGRDALRQLQELTFDLVLMDLAMPEMDGWTATKHMKAHPHLLHIPVLAVTGHVTADDLQRAQDVGCLDYVEKPIDYERMISKVRHYLSHAHAVGA